MNPKISIIVPVYNVEPYIHKCINSILEQTFKEFELILVDDGSPDNCGSICDEFIRQDKRIKVIHKENGGLSSARNAGLNIAKGEYIAFVDSDDFIHKRMYDLLYRFAKKNSSDIVICDYLDVYEGEIHDIEYYNSFKEENYTNIESLYELYTDKGVQFVIACNKLYKKHLFNDLRFEEGRLHEDEFLAHRIFFKSFKVTYLPVKLYFYLQRKDGIIRSKFNIKQLDAIRAYKNRVEFFKEIKQPILQSKAEYNYISLFFLYYFKAKKEIPNCDQELKVLRKDFCMGLNYFIKNPNFILKEKICWFLFLVHPSLFDFVAGSNKT